MEEGKEPGPFSNVIHVDFGVDFRISVANAIRMSGAKRIHDHLITQKYHPSFVKALVRSIVGKGGW